MLIFFMTFSWLEAPWRYSARLYGRGLSKIAHSEGAPADKAGGVTRLNARGHTHDARSARVPFVIGEVRGKPTAARPRLLMSIVCIRRGSKPPCTARDDRIAQP